MCECLHRASTSKISLKNVAPTPTFSFSLGDVCWQTTALDLSQYFLTGVVGGGFPIAQISRNAGLRKFLLGKFTGRCR
jgi:hypothetical protein